MNQVGIGNVLHLRDLELERLDEDQAIIGFAKKAEAELSRWLDFAKGALLFLTVPGDPESGWFYIYDRGQSAFYSLALPVTKHFGGFGENEFDQLVQTYDLVTLARNPRLLAN